MPTQRTRTAAGARLAEFNSLRPLLADDASFHRSILWLVATVAHSLHHEHGGCTVDLTGEPVRSGFAVALREPGSRVRSISVLDIFKFIEQHFASLRDGGLVLGTWFDDAAVDVPNMILATKVFGGRGAAMEFARRHGQRFVWDLSRGVAIKVRPISNAIAPIANP